MRRFLYVATVIIYGCLISCSQRKEKGRLLSHNEMANVMWDMFQADAFTQSYIKTDSTKRDTLENVSLYKKIFELHHINRDDFSASYDFYSERPSEMKILLDTITTRAERNRTRMMMTRYSKATEGERE